MKKTSIALACAIACLSSAHAQLTAEPQPITGLYVEKHEPQWYAEQAALWNAKVLASPTDERAWKNYYMATTYAELYEANDTVSADLAFGELENAIPDTYTYYYCKYRNQRDRDGVAPEVADSYLRKALEMLPKKMDFFDYDVMTFFCATHDNCPKLKQIATSYLNSGLYSPYVLDYSRNELRSCGPDGIYIAHLEPLLISKWVLINSTEEFKDNYCIYYDMLSDAQYVEKVFRDLGVTEDIPTEFSQYGSTGIPMIIKALYNRTMRPVYFGFGTIDENSMLYKDVYPEGLVDRLSKEEYDFQDKITSHLEQAIDHKAMCQPASADKWQCSNQLAMGYANMLTQAIYYYAVNSNKAKAEWAYKMLTDIVNATTYDDEQKKAILSNADLYIDSARKGIDPYTVINPDGEEEEE